MASTVIRGAQIKDSTVQRHDLDTSTVGQAVVTKIVQGSGITLSSTGADSGTGDVTVTSPDVVSTDAGNIATLGTDSHILVPQSQIWSVRLRTFNALGNPTFEVAQRNCRSALVNPASNSLVEDRWLAGNSALNPTFQGLAVSGGAGSGVMVPGTSFVITKAYLRITIGTQKVSLAATDSLYLQQNAEGPQFRELMSDIHSAQVLVRSSVANLKFGIYIKDPTGSRTLTKLCTLGAASTISLIQAPNLPVFPSAGTFVADPGSVGYSFGICLACGSTYTSPANDTWQTGNFLQAVGADNFLANTVGSTFEVFFIQHEPGALCTTPIDCPFTQNLDECLRYYQKSYDYATAVGTVTTNGLAGFIAPAANPSAQGPLKFHKPMAKVPTMNLFNHATGAVGSVQDNASVNHANAAANLVGSTGFSQIGFTTAVTSPMPVWAHYIADTGW